MTYGQIERSAHFFWEPSHAKKIMSSILIDKHFAFQVVFSSIMTVTQNPSFRHKIIVLPYTYTLSHLSRPLAIAKELRNRGFEVIFAGESRNQLSHRSRHYAACRCS